MYSAKRRFRLFRDPAWSGGGGPPIIGNAILNVDYTITNDLSGRVYYNFRTTGKTMTVQTTTSMMVEYVAIGLEPIML